MTETTSTQSSQHWRGAEEAAPQPALGYGGFAPRPPGLFAITRGQVDVTTLPPPLAHVFREFDENLAADFIGLTTDGTPRTELFPVTDTGIPNTSLVHAAQDYLALLADEERPHGLQPIDSPGWRSWINAFVPSNLEPRGVLLDEATDQVRAAALRILELAFSPRGYAQVRTSMRINAALGRIAPGYEDTLREYMYWFVLYGEPSADRPWGFQLYGHHTCVNVAVLGGQLTIGPMFLGAEPRVVENGPFAGERAFDDELRLGLDLMVSLNERQAAKATLAPSVKWDELPAELAHPTEGRMRGSVARDNAVVPVEGIPARELEPGQRGLLRTLIAHYVGRLPEVHARLKMADVDAHLDETTFAWAGRAEEGEPFYYKVHSPVIFIEIDAHSGIFLSNDDPEAFHIHNVVRIPNGNDYGRAWIAAFEQREEEGA